MPNPIAAHQLPDLLRPGMTVFVQGSTGQPTTLLRALQAAPEASRGVHYIACLLPGVNDVDPSALHTEARLTTFFQFGEMGLPERRRRLRFMPLHYSAIYDYLAALPPVDMALIQVAAAGDDVCLGVSVDFVPAILPQARTVVAEVNRAMPAPPGSPRLPLSRLDYVVDCEHPLPTAPGGAPGATLQAIAGHVAGLVRDGDTVQVGIGKLPAAILAALAGHREIGVQGGMVADEMVDLAAAGALDGRRKTRDAGRIVCGVALGTAKVYDWVAGREDVLFRPVDYTHNVRVIAGIDNFVSINSVLEVDLTGQANAETVQGRQISGTGGLMDFVRGARLARGGRSILALPSTAGGGAVSRIVPRLAEGAVVSCPRADIDYVVTEHGVAHLAPLAVTERAAALTEIADPAFRQALRQAAKS
jgi:4-hydroxybutyrate CoA-transferase